MNEIDRSMFAGYRIDAVVGRGGMGVVYRATQLDLDRIVALKVIAAELLDDEGARRSFVQESRLAAGIDHPHVIPIHAAGEKDGVPYLVMKYVAGDDARSLVRREGPLAPARAARVVAQVGDALDAAHAAGLVHRDVKPANVLLGAHDHAYLSDFGLTRHVRSITGASEHWVGTLDYVAPEQIRGGQVDARADVYSLGCLLFFLLTGDVPFARDTDEARLWAHLTAPPPPVPVPRFEPVIARALAKAPDDRYPSAGDLGRAALAAAGGREITVPERTVARGNAAPVETPTRGPAPARSTRRRRSVLVVAAAIAAAAAAAVLIATAGDEPDRSDRIPTPTPTVVATPEGDPRVDARVPVGRRPNALRRAGGRLWVGSFRSPTLDAVNPRTGRAVTGLEPDVGEGVSDLAFARGQLWVATRAGTVVRLDPDSGRPAGTPIALPMQPVVLAASGDDVVAGVETDDGGAALAQLIRLDAVTGAVETTADVSHGMTGALYARGWLWTLHGDPNFIVRRHPETLVAHQRIDLPGSSVGALAFGEGAFWATIPDQDRLVRYRPRSRRLADVEVGARPIGVALADRRVWVALSGSSTLQRVRPGDLELAGDPIRVPLNPYTLMSTRGEIWLTSVGQDVVARVR